MLGATRRNCRIVRSVRFQSYDSSCSFEMQDPQASESVADCIKLKDVRIKTATQNSGVMILFLKCDTSMSHSVIVTMNTSQPHLPRWDFVPDAHKPLSFEAWRR